MVSVMIILAKLELTLLIIVTVNVHVELKQLKLAEILWLTLIVLFPLTALYETSASQSCSLVVLSNSSTTPGGEYIFYVFSCVLHFS